VAGGQWLVAGVIGAAMDLEGYGPLFFPVSKKLWSKPSGDTGCQNASYVTTAHPGEEPRRPVVTLS
jgi:hypothetical protein